MTLALKSLLELVAIGLIIYGYCHEEKVIAWEQKISRKIYKKYLEIMAKRG